MSERSSTRSKRFIISTPIIVGTVIGAASLATVGATAAVIANAEVQGVVEAEKLHRIEDVDNGLYNNRLNLNLTAIIAKDLDNIRLTEAWSSQSVNSFSHAKSSNNELNHLFSGSGIFEFSDPRTEQYYTMIENLNSKYSVGLTKAELKEKTRLSVDITDMITTAISLAGSSRKCEDLILVKTLLTPILNHRSRMEVQLVDGKLIPRYGNHSTHHVDVLSKHPGFLGNNCVLREEDVGRMVAVSWNEFSIH
jgi:hypothetical protein